MNQIGLKLLDSFKKLNEIDIQLQKEFKNNGGWLKKMTLNKFTGMTARQKIEQE